MLQRIQTIHLAIAAIALLLLFFFPFNGYEVTNTAENATPPTYGITDHLALLLFATLPAIFSLINIFLYNNRPLQIKFAWVTMIFPLALYGLYFLFEAQHQATLTGVTAVDYKAGLLFPLFAMIFLLLAILAIRKDEKLIRSMDRLR